MDAKRDTSREECERVVSSLTSGAELCSSVWELQDERVQSAVLIRALLDRAEKAEAELEASKRDGERYLWLRDEEYPESLLLMLREAGIHKDKVDAAIDHAIAQGRGT